MGTAGDPYMTEPSPEEVIDLGFDPFDPLSDDQKRELDEVLGDLARQRRINAARAAYIPLAYR